jgi:hypothetical protein
MSGPLICGLKYAHLSLALAFLLLSSSIAILLCLFLGTWVSQGQGNDHWEGSLFKPQIGLKQFQGMSYEEISSVYCTSAQNGDLDEHLYSIYKQNCDLFFYLEMAGVGMIFFEVMTVTLVFIWVMLLILTAAKINCTVCSMCISIFTLLSHTIGLVIYTIFSKIQVGQNCGDMLAEDGNYSVCPGLNYLIVTVVEVGLIVITVSTCCLGFKYMMITGYDSLPSHSRDNSQLEMQEIDKPIE